MSKITTVFLIVILTITPHLVHADLDARFYASLRPAIEAKSGDDNSTRLVHYSSRIGARGFLPFSNNPRSGFVFRGELGFEEEEFLEIQDGPRLLFAGFKGPWGQVSYGRQWSAFYSTVGSFMDVGINQSGFGYVGTERISDTLQYSKLFGATYLQLDLVRDDDDEQHSGFNGFQLGLNYQGPVFRAGLAIDKGRELSRQTIALIDESNEIDDDQPCEEILADCFGGVWGFRLDEYSLDFGINRAETKAAHATGRSLSIQWQPNFLNYYFEISDLDSNDFNKNTIAVGLQYKWTPWISLFAESSVVRRKTTVNNTTIRLVTLGIKVEFLD